MTVDYDTIYDDPALRRGVYGLSELTQYLNLGYPKRVTPSNVARWAQNALSALDHRARRSDYSFADLIGMLVVRNLIDLGMAPREIREAEIFLRQRFGHEHPFLSERLCTDGVDVFYEASPAIAEQLTSANRWGQEVFEPAILSALHRVTYEHQIAATWSPAAGVLIDPALQFGEPCVAGTGITTSRLAELAERAPTHEIATMFDLSEAVVEGAVTFERELARAT